METSCESNPAGVPPTSALDLLLPSGSLPPLAGRLRDYNTGTLFSYPTIAPEFQSNAQAEPLNQTTNLVSPLTGLGIQLQDRAHQAKEGKRAPLRDEFDFSNIPTAYPTTTPPDSLYDFYQPEYPESQGDSSYCMSPTLSDSSVSWMRPLSLLSPELPASPLGTTSLSLISGHCEQESIWSLDALSVSSGIPVNVIAQQISASAELALQYLSSSSQTSGSLTSLASDPVVLGDPIAMVQGCLQGPSVAFGPIADINMYEQGYLGHEPSFCVSPTEVMGDVFHASISFRASSSSSTASSLDSVLLPTISANVDNFVDMQISNDTTPNFACTSGGLGVEQGNIDIDDALLQNFDAPRSRSQSQKRTLDTSDYAPSPQPRSSPSASPSPFPTPPKRRSRVRVLKLKAPRTEGVAASATQALGTTDGVPIILGTPVLDAHRGIHIEDLEAKAERYRLRNPGLEYDKKWLLSFAGKLSNRGELLEEYRCYVVGCRQTNKRRDHILIHLGAHLDQRPFQCQHCPSRFLRKNECKRHELGHIGLRPFACNLCPFEEVTFVRQDLLKRHLKRTHNVDTTKSTSNKENDVECKVTKKSRYTR